MQRILFTALVGVVGGISAPALAASSELATNASPASAAGFNREIKILGKAFGVKFSTGENSTQNGITAKLDAKIFGKNKSLIKANLQTNEEHTEGQLQLYVNGVQVVSTQNVLTSDLWSKNLKLPPVNVDATVFTYGIGPAVLKVDAGYGIEANLKSALSTDLIGSVSDAATSGSADPLTSTSVLKAKIDAGVKATTFVEGSASAVVVKAGLKGQVTAADGTVTSSAELFLNKENPVKFKADGKVSMLGGAVSAFADYWTLFRGWRHFWAGNLFKWKGLCYDLNKKVDLEGTCGTR